MNYAIKHPDGLSIYRVVIDDALPDGPLPAGKTPQECGMWPVDLSPLDVAGMQQDFSTGTPHGWQLVGNTVVPITKPIPPAAPKSPQEIWWEKLSGTITDGPTRIEIAANEATRNLVTGQMVMVTTALNVGAITASTPQDIWDVHGAKHTLPTADLIALILRYGAAWSAMYSEFAP